jgi:hypothetical protein
VRVVRRAEAIIRKPYFSRDRVSEDQAQRTLRQSREFVETIRNG